MYAPGMCVCTWSVRVNMVYFCVHMMCVCIHGVCMHMLCVSVCAWCVYDLTEVSVQLCGVGSLPPPLPGSQSSGSGHQAYAESSFSHRSISLAQGEEFGEE